MSAHLLNEYCCHQGIYACLDDAGLSSLSEVEQGVQHVLADIMAKDFEIINATRQRCVMLPVLLSVSADTTVASVCLCLSCCGCHVILSVIAYKVFVQFVSYFLRKLY